MLMEGFRAQVLPGERILLVGVSDARKSDKILVAIIS